MKRTLTYKFLVFLLALTVISCQKDPAVQVDPTDAEMCLRIIMPEVSVSKGEITNENLKSITLFGLKDEKDLFNPILNQITRTPVKLEKPQDPQTQLWPVIYNKQNYTWGTYATNSVYQFHAYSHNELGMNVKDRGTITTKDEGKYAKITQPKTTYQNSLDYLFSYLVDYNKEYHADSKKPIIPISLEHTMSKVSVFVERKTDIEQLEITFSGLQRECELICEKHKIIDDNTLKQNVWIYRYTKENDTATYTYKESNKTAGPSEQVMSFIAFPADKATMEKYFLTVTSKIHSKTYTRTYQLSNTQNWIHGHHIMYKLLIDDGIHLTGSIKDWKDVDFIEGTILPSA